MNLTRNNWQGGWLPSDDATNGRNNGLLRMDNCRLDENNIVSLCPGTRKIGTEYPGFIHSLYSTYFNAAKKRFLGLGTGDVVLVEDEVQTQVLLEAGHPEYAAFNTAYGHVFIGSADKLVKFDGVTPLPVGLTKPAKPAVEREDGPYEEILPGSALASAIVVDGTNEAPQIDSFQFDTLDTVGSIKMTYNVNAAVFFGGVQGTENDRFQFSVRIGESTKLKKVRVSFIMDDVDAPSNYYTFEWSNDIIPSPFNAGNNVWSKLNCRRKDFERLGADSTYGWENIIGARVEFETTGIITVIAALGVMLGSEEGPLDGEYEYTVVSAHNNGKYTARSAVGFISDKIRPYNGRVRVTIPASPEMGVNEYWLFRRSAEPQIDVTPPGTPQRLERFYRVAIIPNNGDYIDEISDQDVLREGVSVDFRLRSMSEVTDYVLAISPVLVDRVLYVTPNEIIISDSENPDAYNPLHSIRLSSNSFEIPLFLANIGPNECILGTTLDLYRIGGTFRELPDGTLDVYKVALGVGFPPISRSFIIDGSGILYTSSQGISRYNGTNLEIIQGEIKLLLEEEERYEFPGINIIPGGVALYAIAVYHGQIWACMNMKNGDRVALIYDQVNKYWHARGIQAITLLVEDDGMFIGGFGGSAGNFLREINVGTLLDEEDPHPVYILTVYDDNGQPRNRKDTFTLKLIADTGNDPVEIALSKDNGPFVIVATSQFNGMTEKLFNLGDISALQLGKRYALRIKGEVSAFQLSQFTIEYDARPEQLTYLRIPNSNLNTQSRKRFINYPLIIDTLGANVDLYPLIDNIQQEKSVINTPDKTTHIHYFTSNKEGTDIGGIISSDPDNPFEFYDLNLSEAISEKLPTPTKFLVIPQDDYGNPNRKRHSSYKFAINTRGGNVKFIPRLDGVDKSELIFSTNEKRTVEYFFEVDTIGIDIGGTLQSLDDIPFEFYGVIKPQDVEVLPPRLKEFRIPENNYGIASRKRIRTMPMVINTNGHNVQFIPIVDGSPQPPTTLNTATKQTTFHYFNYDSFGVDYSGELVGTEPFEFYGLLKPEEVEILPVGKLFDQIGPFVTDKLGKLLAFRLRIVAQSTSLPYTIYASDVVVHTGIIETVPNVNRVYQVPQIPKTISGTVWRFEFGPTDLPMHRYDLEAKFNISGMQTDAKWVKVK